MNEVNEVRKRSFLGFFIYFIVKIKNDDVFALAAQLAYYLMLSFFPFLILLMTLVGFSDLESMQVLEALKAVLPTSVFELTREIVIEVVDTQSTGLLGVSIALAMWTASSAFRAVIKGINKAYNVKEVRSFFTIVIIAILSTLALATIIILTLTLLVFGEVIGDLVVNILPFDEIVRRIWNIIRFIVIVGIMVAISACIYRYIPSKKIKWTEVIPGAIVTTIGWMIVSLIFSFYINNFANYSRLYGSLGAVFALMTWLYIISIIFILGGEINAVIVIRKNNLKIK